MQTKEFMLLNLREAAEELAKSTQAVESDDAYGFEAWMMFVYRKLNLAYNARNLTPEQIKTMISDEFESYCRFPADLVDEIGD